MHRFRIILAALATAATLVGVPASAQEAGDGFIRIGGARTKLVDKGDVKTNGVLDPAAGYSTRETWHGVVSGSYFVFDHISVDASISTPATTNNLPAGSLAGTPNLGDDEFIVGTVGASFHPIKGPVSPYIGGGYQYQLTTQERDGLGVGLNIPSTHGPYVAGGVNFSLSKRLGVFAEVRKAYYKTNATGLLPLDATGTNFAAVDAMAQLDPLTISFGVVAKFGRGVRDSDEPAIGASNGRWVVKLGMTSLELADKIALNVGGAPYARAGLSTFEHQTPTVQIGYFVTDKVAVNATLGLPPKIDIFGAGSIGPLQLGKMTYGPMTLTAQYHPIKAGRIRPYVGAGVAYMYVFGTKDGAFQNLKVSNDLGPAFEAGVDIMATRKMGVFVDVKKALLRPKATGAFSGMPVVGKAKIDPWAFTGGVSFHF